MKPKTAKNSKPTKAEISRVMSHIGRKKTLKRTLAARKSAAYARSVHAFKYRKLMPEDIIDIRKNCLPVWKNILEFSKKYKVNPTTTWGILRGSKHRDDCLVEAPAGYNGHK